MAGATSELSVFVPDRICYINKPGDRYILGVRRDGSTFAYVGTVCLMRELKQGDRNEVFMAFASWVARLAAEFDREGVIGAVHVRRRTPLPVWNVNQIDTFGIYLADAGDGAVIAALDAVANGDEVFSEPLSDGVFSHEALTPHQQIVYQATKNRVLEQLAGESHSSSPEARIEPDQAV